MAPAALVGAVVLASLCALLIDIPAALFGVDVTSANLPGGLLIADTVVQEVIFVVTVVLLARIGGRTLTAAKLGLRETRLGWVQATIAVVGLQFCFLIFSVAWALSLHISGKEKVLEQLGANEGTALLLASAALTCAVAPVCEEILFRGFIFGALRKWSGTAPAALLTGVLFGVAHAGSAPVVDLVPLGVLGAGLCLLYRFTGSLYPCMAAHALNNSVAFGELESWSWWKIAILVLAALLLIRAFVLALRGLGITKEPTDPPSIDPFGGQRPSQLASAG